MSFLVLRFTACLSPHPFGLRLARSPRSAYPELRPLVVAIVVVCDTAHGFPASGSSLRSSRHAWCRLPFCLRHTVVRPCVRRMEALEWHCPRAAAFPPLPPSSIQTGLFGRLHRYYAAVRLPGCVHRRRSVTPFPTRSALDCSTAVDCSMTDTPRLSRFPYMMRLCMLRSPTPPSSCHSCQSEMAGCCLSCVGTTSALESCTLISGLNTGPAHPLSTLHWRCYHRQRMTRGQGGWLGLPC